MSQERVLRHATRMAVVTMASRLTGWIRDKALFFVLGASDLNDAFRVANRIPNAFRALLAEGALHAAFVPSLSRLAEDDAAREEAKRLANGVLAVLLLTLAIILGLGIVFAPAIVRLFAEGYRDTPGKAELTVQMTRLMFPYLGFISVAALLQGVLNSHEKFLLSAATPIFYNLSLTAFALGPAARVDNPAVWLSAGVVFGGFLQFAVQWPSVHLLGYRLAPLWAGMRDPAVRRVVVLMLPGIPVLGINQINQLVSTRFASYCGEGAVSVLSGAYRMTELMFGGLVVQLTTVLLPVLSRQLRRSPETAPRTLLETITLVSFVTLPTATFLFFAGTPMVGLAFGGGRLGPAGVLLMGSTLTAYAFSLVGLGQAKVMASAFFAQRETKTPMWCSLASLIVFTAGCFILVERYGTVGIGVANTIAVITYGILQTALYTAFFGFGGTPKRPAFLALGRQVVGCGVLAAVALTLAPWLADVQATSVAAFLKVGLAAAAAGGSYCLVVLLLGGREITSMWAGFTGRRSA